MAVGRPFKFTPKEFEEAWNEYFKWCDENPWQKNEVIKSGALAGQIVQVPTQRPYSETGFCVHHKLGGNYISQLAERIKGKKDSKSVGLSDILTRARAKCRAQKFEGAVIGVFNPNIIARDLGLADKQELSGPDGLPIQTESTNIDLSVLTSEQLNALRILKKAIKDGGFNRNIIASDLGLDGKGAVIVLPNNGRDELNK